MRRLLVLMMLFLWVTFAFAAELKVVSELFSWTQCSSCPGARSALYSYYLDNQDTAIPIIWSTTENASNQRYATYPHPDGNYYPYYAVNGDFRDAGGHTASHFQNLHDQLVPATSPIAISMSYQINGNNITVTADVTLESDLTPDAGSSVIYFFALTDHSPTAGNYRSKMIDFEGHHDFTLRNANETTQLVFNANSGSVNPTNTHAVLVIQERSTYMQTVFQGASIDIQQFEANFASDVTSGPPELLVQFKNMSTGPNSENTTYRWNFGDDSAESTEENPIHVYDTVGNYTVKLYATDNTTNEVDSLVMTNYIQCTDPAAGIAGHVTGYWKPEYGQYYVNGEIQIDDAASLIIAPGTELIFGTGCTFEVNGALTLVGTEDNPIMLTGEPETRSLWDGMRIETDATVSISHCVFKDFRDTAVNIADSDVSLNNCTFTNGSLSNENPGILRFYNCRGLTFSDLYIYNNTVGNGAGLAKAIQSSNITLDRVVFANNSSSKEGLLYLENSVFNLRNMLVVNNRANNRYVYLVSSSYANMINCTFVNNEMTTPSSMKGIVFAYSGTAVVKNSIFDNSDYIELHTMGTGTVDATYSAIKGGYTGSGNIDTANNDPMFTMPSEGIGIEYQGLQDWTLQTGSPCIDAGDPADTYYDLEDPNNPGQPLAPAKGTLTNDMGAYGYKGCLPTTGIVDNDDDYIPSADEFTVKQEIYPNPFNPTTNIKLSIGKNPQNVTVKIYNIRGQLVKTLVDNKTLSGTKSVEWNGKDSNNNSVSTGVYFSSAEIGGKLSTKKMVLLK